MSLHRDMTSILQAASELSYLERRFLRESGDLNRDPDGALEHSSGVDVKSPNVDYAAGHQGPANRYFPSAALDLHLLVRLLRSLQP